MMKRKQIMTAAAAGLISLTAFGGAASAAGTTQNDGDHAEVQAFLNAPTSMTAAIKAAEAASGGKAFAAEFDESKGTSFYEVDTLNGDKILSVKIDPASGKVIESKDEGPMSKQGDDDDFVDPAAMKVALTDLVAKAEAEQGGKVMAIGFEGEDGKTQGVEIELAKPDGSTHDVLFDPASGKMTAMVDSQDQADNGGDQGEAHEQGEAAEQPGVEDAN